MSDDQPGGTPSEDGGGTAPTLEKAALPGEETAGMAQSASAARYEPDGDEEGPAGRFWSVRRGPAVVLAAVLLAAAGTLLYDVAAVRADQRAAEWRRTLADELATRRLDDVLVVLTAVAAILLGVWLVVLAVTPGLRGVLAMRQDSDQLRAGIERAAAAAVLRHRALEVSGVRSARVTVGRRRVRVLAEAHFRELDAVRADLDAVLGQGIGELGLARQPAMNVHVRRPPRR